MESETKDSLEAKRVVELFIAELMKKYGYDVPALGEPYSLAGLKVMRFLNDTNYALEQIASQEGVL